jgi:DNA-binding transcriptional MerR regulator
MITIGQLAGYAGVTIKAVRHYHQRGLLEEPSRDSSGYRRYTAEHAIKLIKIATLAKAGVPLARIKELLAAKPDRFAAALAEIDANLKEQTVELRRTRERIACLRSGDRLFVSEEVADYLDQLQDLGISQREVQVERDGWILMQSVSPKDAAIWFAGKRDAFGDPEFRAIYVEYDAAFEWSPDDPRLEALADRAGRWLAAQGGGSGDGEPPYQDRTIIQLLATSIGASSPAWDRLTEIARERTGSVPRWHRRPRRSDAEQDCQGSTCGACICGRGRQPDPRGGMATRSPQCPGSRSWGTLWISRDHPRS